MQHLHLHLAYMQRLLI